MSENPKSQPLDEMGVFLKALEKTEPGERDAFLREACGSNQALRSSVEALLKHHHREGGVLETPALARHDLSLDPNPVFLEGAGIVIGNYTLEEKIGEGGCGVVYKARQEKPLRRHVALKVIKWGMDTKEVIARFDAERQALALMSHSHIAKVIDAGATVAGRPYFVMEWVPGQRITDYCDEHRLSMVERIQLFIKVCHAVQHAHQKGIIHRDLKPSNILVMEPEGGEVPVPKVIDFGIAKATEERLTDLTLVTQGEQFLGTPAYMSPEQASGGNSIVDTQSDIYSLGVILYELLTGSTPIQARDLQAAGPIGMRQMIVEKNPHRPSNHLTTLTREERNHLAQLRQMDPEKLRHQLKGDMDRVVMKALEKDKELRYQTAAALADDLNRFLNHEPVAAIPSSTGYRVKKFIRRNRIGVAVASIVGLMALVGFWLNMKETRRATEAEKQAKLNQQAALVAAQKSEQTAKFMTEMLEAVEPGVAAGRNTELLRAILDDTARRLDQANDLFPDVEADLRHRIGKVWLALGRFEEGKKMYEKELAIVQSLYEEDHPKVIEAMERVCGAVACLKDLRVWDAWCSRILVLSRRRYGSDHEVVSNAIQRSAMAKIKLGQVDLAESLLQEALAMQERMHGPFNSMEAQTYAFLGRLWKDQDKDDQAESAFQQALEIAVKHQLPSRVIYLGDLAYLSLKHQDYAKAEDYMKEALELQIRQQGEFHPDTSHGHSHLAGILQKGGKLAEAELHWRRCLEIRQRAFPETHDLVRAAQSALAQNLKLQARD